MVPGTLMIKWHESRDLTAKSYIVFIDEEGFRDKFRQVPAAIFLCRLDINKKGLDLKKTKNHWLSMNFWQLSTFLYNYQFVMAVTSLDKGGKTS